MKPIRLAMTAGFMALAAGCGSETPESAMPAPSAPTDMQTQYSVETLGDVVQLRDTGNEVVISVLTPVSNAYEMVVKGENILRMRIASVDQMRARPGLNGMPLLAPFANRLDEPAFYANGQKYNFDVELGNVRAPVPIHGYVTGASAWEVIDSGADASGAWVTSKLDFYRNPMYMAQFPFAHSLTMTYRLTDGAMEVQTRIDNLSNQPMPVAIGYHPYFQLTDSTRNEWTLSVPAETHWILDERNIPTGETQPAEAFWGANPNEIQLSNHATQRIDDVFTDLVRDEQGRSTFSMHGVNQTVSVTVGPKYRTMLVYSTAPEPSGGGGGGNNNNTTPPVSQGPDIPLSANDTTPSPGERGFVAFEPMVGITNSMNLAHRGLYDELQYIPPGESWEESFWVSASGY